MLIFSNSLFLLSMPVYGSPPFCITPAIKSLVSDIVAAMLPLSWEEERARRDVRHRHNFIQKIHASLAMEQCTLGIDEVADHFAGRRTAAMPHEIRELNNTWAAYDSLSQYQPESIVDMRAAHHCLMQGLILDAGRFRRFGSGLARGRRVLYLAPPADHVRTLMRDLLGWLSGTEVHPLIAGCVFHCELEFIHPFADGNGRMGRLWQTLIHSRWNPLFASLPWESVLHEKQETFYQILADCDSVGNSTSGVEFLLHAVLQSLWGETNLTAQMSLIPLQERIH